MWRIQEGFKKNLNGAFLKTINLLLPRATDINFRFFRSSIELILKNENRI